MINNILIFILIATKYYNVALINGIIEIDKNVIVKVDNFY